MMVLVRLIDMCNLKCRMCRVWKPGNASKEIMSIETLEKVLDKLKNARLHGKRVDTIRIDGNREGCLYPKLAEAVAVTKSYGFNVLLYTNGTLLNEKLSYSLVKAGIDRINFSVSGTCSQTHARFQGYGMPPEQFEKIYNNICCFNKVKRDVSGTVCHTQVSMIMDNILAENSDEYRKALDFWQSAGCDSVLVQREQPKLWKSEREKAVGGADCAVFPVVDTNGDCFPCCGGSEDIVIGNILTDEDVFNGEKAVGLYKAIKNPEDIPLPDECKICLHNGKPENHLMHCSYPKLDKTLVKEGFSHLLQTKADKQVVLFGCTEMTKEMISLSKNNGIDVVGIIDNNFRMWGEEFGGVRVSGINTLHNLDVSQTVLCICTRNIADALELFAPFLFDSIYAYALFFEQAAQQYQVFTHIFEFDS